MSPKSTVSDPEPLVIDCATCVARHSDACDDCVVTFMCGHERESAVVIDVAEYRALRLLHEGGLVPRLRHQRGA
jgi:hypothetical protein